MIVSVDGINYKVERESTALKIREDFYLKYPNGWQTDENIMYLPKIIKQTLIYTDGKEKKVFKETFYKKS